MQEITTIGLDLAKSVFQVHAASADSSMVLNRKLRRSREIQTLGHDVRLMPPAYVKPFVKRGNTDAADAEAIAEAVTRKTMRFVPVKSAEQQAMAVLVKSRALLVRQRTQASNALRAHLAEFGIIAGTGITKVAELIAIARDESVSAFRRWLGRPCARSLSRSRAWQGRSSSSIGRLSSSVARIAIRAG